jgi:SAM-dependent methyltransferase
MKTQTGAPIGADDGRPIGDASATGPYTHGYSDRECERLRDQAATLADLLHWDTSYPPGSLVLEAGCGVGAQTAVLAQRSPAARFASVDRSPASVDAARQAVGRLGLANVELSVADIFDLPFAPDSFDHVFVCFVLEHLSQPLAALERLKAVLRPGGTLTLIEGDHGSTFFYPESRYAARTVDCLVSVQARHGGNALIGRQLYPLLRRAGFVATRVTPRQVYADSSRPEWVQGFTRNTFAAMVEGVRDQALAMGLIDVPTWERGIADLHATAGQDGTFSYTFFKGVATKP